MDDLEIGQYSLPVIMSIVLGAIYHVAGSEFSNRLKPIISIVIGAALGLIALAYKGGSWDPVNIIAYTAYGLVSGAAGVGLYETKRAIMRPRP